MKSLIFCFSFLLLSLNLMAQEAGFYFQSGSTSPFSDYTADEIARKAPSSETSEENQFIFALKDGFLLHITDSETQVYMITSIIEKDGVYIIESLSGLSGNKYYYYIDNTDYKPVLAMLVDIQDEKMSGIRYNSLQTKQFKGFRQY
jgi:hypothetical protein